MERAVKKIGNQIASAITQVAKINKQNILHSQRNAADAIRPQLDIQLQGILDSHASISALSDLEAPIEVLKVSCTETGEVKTITEKLARLNTLQADVKTLLAATHRLYEEAIAKNKAALNYRNVLSNIHAIAGISNDQIKAEGTTALNNINLIYSEMTNRNTIVRNNTASLNRHHQEALDSIKEMNALLDTSATTAAGAPVLIAPTPTDDIATRVAIMEANFANLMAATTVTNTRTNELVATVAQQQQTLAMLLTSAAPEGATNFAAEGETLNMTEPGSQSGPGKSVWLQGATLRRD
jgi:hypothetical protein